MNRKAVEALLGTGQHTPRQIAVGTGICLGHVRNAISQLRACASPLTLNILREPPVDRLPPDPKVDAGQVVASALDRRTPLEQAWGAQS